MGEERSPDISVLNKTIIPFGPFGLCRRASGATEKEKRQGTITFVMNKEGLRLRTFFPITKRVNTSRKSQKVKVH